ncbi:hypothetical protein FRB99_002542 [Tulasnella sp. 403]|nr:hypothetical protein FRB99_002542 [Tulasnella sp. 403]
MRPLSKIFDRFNTRNTIAVIGAVSKTISKAEEVCLLQRAKGLGYRSSQRSRLDVFLDGDETCYQAVSLISSQWKLISQLLRIADGDYIRSSDESEVNIGKEAFAAFQSILDDSRKFLRLYEKGNRLSRLTRINELEDHLHDAQSDQACAEFERITYTIPGTSALIIRKPRVLPPVSDAVTGNSTHRFIPVYESGMTIPFGNMLQKRKSEDKSDSSSAANLPLMYGYSAATNAPFIVLSNTAVTGFLEYLNVQSKLDKSHALLTAWSMLVDIKVTATFLQENNPRGAFLRRSVTDVVVDNVGKVLMACPLDVATPLPPDSYASSLSDWTVQFWLPHFTEWRGLTPSVVPRDKSSSNTAADPPTITRALRLLGLVLHHHPALNFLMSKDAIPKTAETAKYKLRQFWSPPHYNRYLQHPGELFHRPVPGDFGVFRKPDLGASTFLRFGNISEEHFGGITISTYPFSTYGFWSIWRYVPKIRNPRHYQYTIPPRSKQDSEYRHPDWTIQLMWSCALVDKDLDWDILLLHAKRLADEWQVAPEEIVLVTETSSCFRYPDSLCETLRCIIDTTEVELQLNIYLDDSGHIEQLSWFHDGMPLKKEDFSRLGLPYPGIEDLKYNVHVNQCLKVEKGDLLL